MMFENLESEFGLHHSMAYLFQGLSQGMALLEEDSYILEAFNTQGSMYGHRTPLGNDDLAFISRWPENQFPLKVFAGPDYGYLFNPLELKQLAQMVQNALGRIQTLDPEGFRFLMVADRNEADVFFKWRRCESSVLSHCTPDIGREKQIKRAEIVISIPKSQADSYAIQSRMTLAVYHNLLHALGIWGHSNNVLDSGAKEWSLQQQALTVRDVNTLKLLYRCPLAITRKDFMLLWKLYQKQYLILPAQGTLESMWNRGVPLESLVLPGSMMSTATELSKREVALQHSFQQLIQQFKTA